MTSLARWFSCLVILLTLTCEIASARDSVDVTVKSVEDNTFTTTDGKTFTVEYGTTNYGTSSMGSPLSKYISPGDSIRVGYVNVDRCVSITMLKAGDGVGTEPSVSENSSAATTAFDGKGEGPYPFKLLFHGSNEFDEDQKTLIKSAMGLVNKRLLSARVFKCIDTVKVRNLAKKWYLEKSEFDLGSLWPMQRYYLGDLAYEDRPTVTINSIDKPIDATGAGILGEAHFNKVMIVSGDGYDEGNFEIALNKNAVNAPIYNMQNRNVWAGVIAHEMLHNLGHNHPKDVTDHRYNSYLINVVDQCVEFNGNIFESDRVRGEVAGEETKTRKSYRAKD